MPFKYPKKTAKISKKNMLVTGAAAGLAAAFNTPLGGIVFAIAQELSIPVVYITFGEQSDQIKVFNAQEYVTELLG